MAGIQPTLPLPASVLTTPSQGPDIRTTHIAWGEPNSVWVGDLGVHVTARRGVHLGRMLDHRDQRPVAGRHQQVGLSGALAVALALAGGVNGLYGEVAAVVVAPAWPCRT